MLEIDTAPPAPPPARSARRAAIVLAIAMLTGAVGFVVGRALAPDDDRTAVGNTADSVAVETADTTDLPVPSTIEPADGASGDVPATMAPAGDAVSEDTAAAESASNRGSYSGEAYAEPARQLVAERAAPGDVVLRAHGSTYDTEGMYNPWGPDAFEGWTPAAWCYPVGDLRVGISTPTSVNTAYVQWFAEPKDGLAVTTFATGYIEGDPMFGVVAQVSPDVTSVTLTTAHGSDTTAPMGGVAMLIVPGPIDEAFTVTIDRADGSSDSADAGELTEQWASVEYRDACQPPPPALPPAGEQPADPEAARAAVDAAWATVHGGRDGLGHDERAAAVDDTTGLDDAWTVLESGEYADAAATSSSTFRELVFVSPAEAWFRYDIETTITNFYDRYGRAVLGDDGVWRITRQTVCQDLSLAPGNGCAPAVEPLLPPSAATDPRYQGMPSEEMAAD